MLNICIMDVSKLEDDALYQKAYRLCDKRRQKKADILLPKEDKFRCIGAGILLSYMLRKHGICLKNEEVGFSLAGKPYLKNHERIHFNLSHSGKFVACAVSNCPVGIDIQELKVYNEKVVTRFFAKEDQALLSQIMDDEERGKVFTTLFSTKESYAKKKGISVAYVLGEFIGMSPICRYYELNGERYVLTVVR